MIFAARLCVLRWLLQYKMEMIIINIAAVSGRVIYSKYNKNNRESTSVMEMTNNHVYMYVHVYMCVRVGGIFRSDVGKFQNFAVKCSGNMVAVGV